MTRCVVLTELQGETVLHTAAQWGYPRVVDLLLSHGADPSAKFKVSPFHCQAAGDVAHHVSSRQTSPESTLLAVAILVV